MLVSATVSGQIAHINEAELMQLMPEMKTYQEELQKFAATLDTNYSMMLQEYATKQAQYQKDAENLPESIRETRAKELADMQSRIANFEQKAQQDLQKKQQELLKPIMDKINDAIAQVAKEKGYKYVFDTSLGNPVYADDSDNIMEDVKKKLGITQ